MKLTACPLAAGAAPYGCDWCGRLISKRQRRHRWCSDRCRADFEDNHVWAKAREAARRRDHGCCVAEVGGVRCGSTVEVEVNHIVPLAGRPRTESCMHHLANLETLCRAHHLETTAKQRAEGLFDR